MRNAYIVLVGKSEGKRPLGRPGHRWKDITIDIRELGWKGEDWFHQAHGRDHLRSLVNTLMKLWVP
jgi:hypothetical protein